MGNFVGSNPMTLLYLTEVVVLISGRCCCL